MSITMFKNITKRLEFKANKQKHTFSLNMLNMLTGQVMPIVYTHPQI